IAGHTPGERIAFGNSILALASQFSALFPPPIRPDTVGGYVEFRGFHPLAILFAVWALASATGAARGDEERGIVVAALGTGISRLGLIAARTIAFAIGVVIAAAAAAAGFLVGVASGHVSVSPLGVIEAAGVLVGVSVVAAAAAAAAFEFRDLGSALVRPPRRASRVSNTVSGAAWWRWPVWRGVFERRIATAVWAVGMAALAIVFVSLTRTIVQVLLSIP